MWSEQPSTREAFVFFFFISEGEFEARKRTCWRNSSLNVNKKQPAQEDRERRNK